MKNMHRLLPLVLLAGCAGAAPRVADVPPATPPTYPLTIDFLEPLGLSVNGAGPVQVAADPSRPRIVAASSRFRT